MVRYLDAPLVQPIQHGSATLKAGSLSYRARMNLSSLGESKAQVILPGAQLVVTQ